MDTLAFVERKVPDDINLVGKTLAQVEAHAIKAAYERCGGNIMRTAKALRMARSTLHRKLTALGLRIPRGHEGALLPIDFVPEVEECAGCPHCWLKNPPDIY